jgi:hypothetical protein
VEDVPVADEAETNELEAEETASEIEQEQATKGDGA